MASKSNKKAFLVIEVLISIFIMFLVIVSLAIIVKQKNYISKKNESYQMLYITVKSLINMLDKTDINTDSKEYVKIKEMNINGFDAEIYAKLLLSKHNYVVSGPEDTGPSGNYGEETIKLYSVKIDLKNGILHKTYIYKLTKFAK
jgi:Tfp pilus assembly protein PilV